jgi:hypothetical protein
MKMEHVSPTQLFLWQDNRSASLSQARNSGCALGLWFNLGLARASNPQEFAFWLQQTHAKYGARFGRSR